MVKEYQETANFMPQQVERICMNRALIRRYDVGGFDQDLEHQMLQTEIEYRLQRSNIPRDPHRKWRNRASDRGKRCWRMARPLL